MVAFCVIFVGLTCLVCLVLLIFQIRSNRGHSALVSFSSRHLPLCLLHVCLVSLAGIYPVDDARWLIPVNMLIGLFPIFLLSSSFIPRNRTVIICCISAGVVFNSVRLITLHYAAIRWTSFFYSLLIMGLVSLYASYFLVSVWIHICRIRNLIQRTTIWTLLVLSVDVVYLVFITGVGVMIYMGYSISGCLSSVISGIASIQLLLTIVALTYRISTDSLFFIMRRHEIAILESLNDAPSVISGGRTSPDDVYREIFARVVDHFENDMPFLSGNLVIDDLVKVVFANKLYISRAISRCAGRNFCQFVNYYRVRHSVEVFRQNPELKVSELASQCGFNSVGSYTMAFKLYMNENPSDWIRQERSRMLKSRT